MARRLGIWGRSCSSLDQVSGRLHRGWEATVLASRARSGHGRWVEVVTGVVM